MEECLNYGAKATGAKVNINRDDAYQAVLLDVNEPVFKIAKDAIISLGLTPKEKVVGGGTDASIYNANGLPTIVLGVGQKMEHTVNEHIKIEDMDKAVSILHYIFERLA
jgi:tripeptide aminopeptidase